VYHDDPSSSNRKEAANDNQYQQPVSVAFERITINPDVMGGLPVIRGLRMPVATVVAMVAGGRSVASILDDFPALEADDIAEALRYAAAAVLNENCRYAPRHEVLAR
jgi:uncharacterized protein (DUF433 family)